MSGARYIKQAIIAALVDHPDQDRYKTRAFSNDNLAQSMEASAQGHKLTKADFFTPDDEGRYIIDTPGFWKNFDKVLDVLNKSGEKFVMDDFTRYLDRNETRNLLESAKENQGLAKIFSQPVWQGRFDEMERLWYKVPVPHRRDTFRNDGLLDPALKRNLLAFEGRTMPEDGLAKAGLTANDLRFAFIERGNFEEVNRKLGQAGDYFKKDYLMLPDNAGDTVFYYQNAWDKYDELVKGMKSHGEKFEVADFVRPVGFVSTILARAAERKALSKIFTADHWVDRLPEMLELWGQVKEGWKTSAMSARDFDNAYSDAESKTYAKKVDFTAFDGKAALLSPVAGSEGPAAILPLGLRALWDDYAAVEKRLAQTGEKIKTSDLRTSSGLIGNTCLMGAVKFGHFDKVVDIARKSAEPLTLDDFLSKDRHGNTLLNILAERNQLNAVFSPDLWAGRVNDMKTLWTNVRVGDKSQVDFQQAEVAAKQATLKLQAKDRFKLKPGGF